MVNWKKIGWYLGFTFGLSYLTGFIAYFLHLNKNMPLFMAFGVVYMFFPAIAVLIVQKGLYKQGIKESGISWKINKWWYVAWLSMPIISILTIGVTLLFPGISFSPEMAGMFERFKNMLSAEQMEQMRKQIAILPIHVFWITLLQGLIAGITVNAIAGFGEELGWRGLMSKELIPLGFWKSSLIIGFVWGIWHLPMVMMGLNYPQHPNIGILMMIVWCIMLAPIFNYVTIKSNSVIAASILHGTLNATAGLAIMVVNGGNDLTTGITGLPGFIVLVLINGLLFLHDRFFSVK
jgi:uncharacterized protein